MNKHIKHTNRSLCPRRGKQALLCGAVLLVAPLSIAQEDQEEEIFELSPFTVEGTENEGYRATSTLAGSRIRTDLRDVGSAISVVTEEFLRDTGAVDNESLLVYTTNTEVGGPRGNFAGTGDGGTPTESFTSPNQNTRVRGLSNADNTRNFFRSNVSWDGYNINRVDLQRGPNAILFGLGSPAGIINTTTDNATFTNESEVEIRFGSYGSTRMSFNTNKVLIEDELAVLVAGVQDNEKFRQKPAFEDDQRLYIATRYDPSFLNGDSTSFSLKAAYETGDLESNRPRTLPPMDRITPFFRPVGRVDNGDGTYSYPLYGGTGGALLDPYGAEDETGFYGDGANRPLVNSPTDPDTRVNNPNYLPMNGNFGQNYGGPLTVFGDENGEGIDGVMVHEIKTFGGIDANGNIDGTLSYPYGRLTSIDSYVQYTIDAGLDGAYKNIYLQDPSVFDFWNTLIDGPNKEEWSGFDTFSGSIAQTFFNNKLGYELAYFTESYDQGNLSLLQNGSNVALFIDTNENLGDGSPNPNVGRPFIADSAGGGNNIYSSDRESVRLTVTGEWDFMENGNDGFLSKLLGRHIFTGLVSEDKQETDSINFQRWITGPENADELQRFGWDGSPRTANEISVNTVHYLGDSLLGRSSASGAYVPGISAVHTPESGSYWSFDSTWNAGSSVDPAAEWTQADGSVGIQADNPANYVGWSSRPYYVYEALEGDNMYKYGMATGGNRSREKIESQALVWQGYFLEGALVGTYGWRKDKDYRRNLNASPFTDSTTRVFDFRDPNYNLDMVEDAYEEGQSNSYSAILHVNELLGDRLPFNISFGYNESENFQPGAGRVDVYGLPISSPTGSTRDASMLLSTKDNRYSLKVTDYKTSVQYQDSSYIDGTWFIANMVTWGTNWANVAKYNISDGYTLDGVWDPSNTDNSWRYNFDGEDEVTAAWADFTAAIPQEWLESWNINGNLNTDVIEFFGGQPSGLAYTQDSVSEGLEFEFVANPTQNWRVSLNAAKTKATRTNVGGESFIEWVNFVDSWVQDTPAGDVRIWWSGGPTIQQEWNNSFRNNFAVTQMLEGTSNPEIRKWRYNLVSTYSFSEGALKGMHFGGSFRWADKVVVGYPSVSDEDGRAAFDLTNPYYGPSEENLDLWIGYSRPLNDKINWRVQLNARDVLADKELIPIAVQPNGDWATVRIPGTASWMLTNTFSF